MAFDLMVLSGSLPEKLAAADILRMNAFTEQYALTLTAQQAAELARTRSASLKSTGRIEFGGGVIEKIIKSFCDSPYISQSSYGETLQELIELFYFFKNETLDLLGDDELIRLMKKYFDDCHGSLDLLANRDLEIMAHNVRYGFDPEYRESDPDEKEEDDDEY
jgi:hypothetical protein